MTSSWRPKILIPKLSFGKKRGILDCLKRLKRKLSLRWRKNTENGLLKKLLVNNMRTITQVKHITGWEADFEETLNAWLMEAAKTGKKIVDIKYTTTVYKTDV